MVLSAKCCAIVIVISISCIACGSAIGLGPCPKTTYMENFNLSRFIGHWYEIERSFYLMELISTCVSVNLTLNHKGQLEIMVNSKSRMSGSYSITQGIATPTKRDPSLLLYKVNSKLPRTLNRYLPGAGYYQILQTDYNRYAIVYSCTNFYFLHLDLVLIWARQKEIDVELRAKIYNILARNHFDPERLTLPKNKNCTDDY